MKVLVVGGGGREHAIIKKLKENKEIEKIYALPGNGGIAADAECVAIGAKDIDGIVDFAKSREKNRCIFNQKQGTVKNQLRKRNHRSSCFDGFC